jgi:hypothetical protein
MDAAFAGRLEVSAPHDRFFFDEPKVYFMHISGHGDAAALASGMRTSLRIRLAQVARVYSL